MRRLAAVALALLIAGISTGAVWAYLTAQDTVKNEVTAADTDIEISENFDPPGTIRPGSVITKTVAVTSHSSTDCYVRVMVRFSSLEAEQFCEPLQILEGWTKKEDGYYYWKEKVKPGETTGNLFTSVKIKQDADTEQLEAFDILVYAEAVAGKDRNLENAWEDME